MGEKKVTLIYDIAAVPKRSTMDEIMEIYEDYKVVLYDSGRGDKPRIVPEDVDIQLIDSSNTIEK